MNTVGLEQGRSRLSELAARANAGEPILLTRHGRPFAAIVSPELLQHAQQQQQQSMQQRRPNGFLALRGTGKGLWQPSPAGLIGRLWGRVGLNR